MVLHCKWTRFARQDLKQIHHYIAKDNAKAAVDLTIHLFHMIESRLVQYPLSGRVGRRLGTRELLIKNTSYCAVYRVQKDRIEVLRIYHQSQSWDLR